MRLITLLNLSTNLQLSEIDFASKPVDKSSIIEPDTMIKSKSALIHTPSSSCTNSKSETDSMLVDETLHSSSVVMDPVTDREHVSVPRNDFVSNTPSETPGAMEDITPMRQNTVEEPTDDSEPILGSEAVDMDLTGNEAISDDALGALDYFLRSGPSLSTLDTLDPQGAQTEPAFPVIEPIVPAKCKANLLTHVEAMQDSLEAEYDRLEREMDELERELGIESSDDEGEHGTLGMTERTMLPLLSRNVQILKRFAALSSG